MSFGTIGLVQGNLEWDRRASKRRADIAKLFEEFKRNNPYATADDYTGYLESLIGPEEYYLRGSMPSGQILQRMEADNMNRKRRDEATANMEMAAKKIAIGNQLKDFAKGRVITDEKDEDIYNAMIDMFQPADAEEREQYREMIKGSVGPLDELRERERESYFLKRQNQMLDMMTKAGPSFDPKQLMGESWNPDKYGWMEKKRGEMQKELDYRWSERERERERKVRMDRHQFRNDMLRNPRLNAMLDPTSATFGQAEKHIRGIASEVYGIDADSDLINDIIAEKQAERGMQMDAAYKEAEKAGVAAEHKRLSGALKSQQDELAKQFATSGLSDDAKKHVAYGSAKYLIPEHMRREFIEFAGQYGEDLGMDTVDKWVEHLGPRADQLIPADQLHETATKRTRRSMTKPTDARGYFSASQSTVDAITREKEAQTATISSAIDSAKNSAQIEQIALRLQTQEASLDKLVASMARKVQKELADQSWNKGADLIQMSDANANIIKPLKDFADQHRDALREIKNKLQVRAMEIQSQEAAYKQEAVGERSVQLSPPVHRQQSNALHPGAEETIRHARDRRNRILAEQNAMPKEEVIAQAREAYEAGLRNRLPPHIALQQAADEFGLSVDDIR